MYSWHLAPRRLSDSITSTRVLGKYGELFMGGKLSGLTVFTTRDTLESCIIVFGAELYKIMKMIGFYKFMLIIRL